MAFLASNQIPADAYQKAKRTAIKIDDKCAEWIGLLASDINADQIWAWYREVKWAYDTLGECAAVPGIAAYAIEQEGDPTYDVAAEFATMRGAIFDAASWVYNAIPRDVNGYTLTHTTTVLGERVPRVFPPAQTAPLIPLLEAVQIAID